MTYEQWVQVGSPHWRCRGCMGIIVTIPIDDDFVCPLCKHGTDRNVMPGFGEVIPGGPMMGKRLYQTKPALQPYPLPLELFGDGGSILMRMDRSGNVELFGDVNEAALRFWAAVCQLSGGVLTKHAKN